MYITFDNNKKINPYFTAAIARINCNSKMNGNIQFSIILMCRFLTVMLYIYNRILIDEAKLIFTWTDSMNIK